MYKHCIYLYSLYIYTQYTVSKVKKQHTNQLCGSYYTSDLIYNCVISLRNINNYVIYHHTINLEIYPHFLEDPKVTIQVSVSIQEHLLSLGDDLRISPFEETSIVVLVQ